MVSTEERLLNVLSHKQKIVEAIGKRELFIFLDYDGTLTPIVNTPEEANLSQDMRGTLKELAGRCKLGIVSGRTIEDVRSRVQLEGIYYVGSHGFEIMDPAGKVIVNKDAQRIRRSIDEIHQQLSERLKDVPGAIIEHVKFTVSTHYRMVSDADFPRVKEAVDETLKEFKDLRKAHGKRVFVIRPKIKWDKGKAVNHVLRLLRFRKTKGFVIYIGDDVTDEDAFAVMDGKGIGILVAAQERPTEADYIVRDPDEVKQALEFFASLSEGQRQ